MFLELNPSDGYLHIQLYRAIRRKILRGDWEEGHKLPSKRILSKELDLSINTVSTAYAQLEAEGYIRAEERRGYFVEPIDHLLSIQSSSPAAPPPIPEDMPPRYDFTYSGVDPDSFPYSIWKRLLRESISSGETSILVQGDPKGIAPLRRVIATYLRESRGVIADPEDIIVSAGTEHLFHLLRLLLGPRANYAFEDPGFAWGNPFFTIQPEICIPIPVDDSGISHTALSASQANVAFVTPAHQFPLGSTMPIKRRVKLLNWAGSKTDRYIIEDDYDSEFKYVGKPVPALKSMDRGDRVIYLGSFSKSLTPALRVSYMVLPKELMHHYERAYSGFICPCSVFIQKALTTFIEEGYFEKHLNRMRGIYSKKRALAGQELSKLRNITISGEEAGLSLLVRIGLPLSEEAIIQRGRELDLGLYGVDRFRKDTTPIQPELILGYAKLTEEEIVEGVRLFGECLADKTANKKG